MKRTLENPQYPLILVLGALIVLMLINSNALAASSQFRMEFIYNRRANQLLAQEALIKNNKDKIPDEIQGFVDEALGFDKTFEERMYLLDNAHALAKMYSVNFGDSTALNEIISIQDMELVKEEERKEERKRLLKYKGLRGSFVMMEHIAQMDELALPPVIYPHWKHQLYFKCKACHDDSFMMKRGSNDMTHAKFQKGAQCGACHNGKVAFDASIDGECLRCHMSSNGIEDMNTIKGLAYTDIDIESIRANTKRLGINFNEDKLVNGKLPLDKFGNIDWLRFDEDGVTEPLASIPGGDKTSADKENKRHKSLIIFKPRSEDVQNVPFSHVQHTNRLECASCHPLTFQDALNSNDVSMAGLATGKFCGACHGKVGSLPLLDCQKCHNMPTNEIPSGALIRE